MKKISKSMAMLVLVLMAVVMEARGVEGQVPQVPVPTCMSTFFGALIQLIPCRAAVAPFSPLGPSPSCCNAIRSLGQPCLCVLINGPPISGVDRNMAMMLPERCAANFDSCQAK